MSQPFGTVPAVRILHTSDWHLGRSFHGAPLDEHQRAFVEVLVGTVREEHVDLVVIAGDLYDRAMPPVTAVETLSWALAELREAGAHVVATAGNHDSASRVGFAEELLTAAGVTLRGDARRCAVPVEVPTADGGPPVLVYALPYLEPELARHALGRPDSRSHEAVLRAALDLVAADRARRGPHRAVLVAHALVTGAATTDSERPLTIGGADAVAASVFDGFDYVALGHLHRVQSCSDRVRYSGAPLAYSFSEADHDKAAWLVDLAPTGEVSAAEVPIPAPRRLARLRGTVDELLADPSLSHTEGSWVQITMTDATPPPEPMARLRSRFPHLVSLVPEPPTSPTTGGSYLERVRGRSDLDLAVEFVAHVTGAPPEAESIAELQAVIDAVHVEAQAS